MSKKTSGGKLFITFCLIFLMLGLIGISRLSLRPGCRLQWENRKGAVVVRKVLPEGVGDRGGLMEGDVIRAIEGVPLKTGQEMEFLIDGRKTGERISFTIQRGDERLNIFHTLVRRHGIGFIAINLFLGALFWAVGLFVYLRKPAEKAARVFSWGCISLAMAIMLVWPGHPHKVGIMGYPLITVYFVFYAMAPALILRFTTLYPEEKSILQRHRFISGIMFAPSIILLMFMGITYFPAVHLKSPEHFRTYYTVFTIFRAYFIVYMAMSIGCLIHSLASSDTREKRNKIQWILWGVCVGASPFTLLWTLPHVLGLSPLIPEEAGYIFVMIVPLTVAFSVVKYRAMDIEIVINRSIVYALITGIIVIMYLVLAGLAGYALQALSPATGNLVAIIFTLIAVILFSPVKTRIQTFVDKTFYRTKYNYQLAIKNFSSALTSVRNQDEVIAVLLEKVQSAIPVEKICLVLRRPSGSGFEVRGADGMAEHEQSKLRFDATDAFIVHLDGLRSPLVKRGRAGFSDSAALPQPTLLDGLGIELVIPVMLQSQLVGFLALGRKRSGARFTEEDLELVTPMAGEGFMAMERLRLQETMIRERAEKEKLQELSRLKSEFMSHVSHEFRTPLTSIRWSVENMMDGIPEKPSPRVQKYLAGIFDSTLHLSRMIENLLDITRIEAGKIEIHPEELNLAEEINMSLDVSRPLAEKKNIRLEAVFSEDVPVMADRDSLRMILVNLLDNAIKYSGDGNSVRVEVSIAEREESGQVGHRLQRVATISVIDQGIGIPREKQEIIFGRFERIKEEQGAGRKGLGLGLHIVRKLVELQNGRIWVESEVGVGSTFTFTLPLE